MLCAQLSIYFIYMWLIIVLTFKIHKLLIIKVIFDQLLHFLGIGFPWLLIIKCIYVFVIGLCVYGSAWTMLWNMCTDELCF